MRFSKCLICFCFRFFLVSFLCSIDQMEPKMGRKHCRDRYFRANSHAPHTHKTRAAQRTSNICTHCDSCSSPRRPIISAVSLHLCSCCLVCTQSTGTEPLVNDVVDVMDPTGAWRHGRIVKIDVDSPIPMIKVAYAWCAGTSIRHIHRTCIAPLCCLPFISRSGLSHLVIRIFCVLSVAQLGTAVGRVDQHGLVPHRIRRIGQVQGEQYGHGMFEARTIIYSAFFDVICIESMPVITTAILTLSHTRTSYL